MGPPREQAGQQLARGGLNQKVGIDEVAARARAQVAARLSVLRNSQSEAWSDEISSFVNACTCEGDGVPLCDPRTRGSSRLLFAQPTGACVRVCVLPSAPRSPTMQACMWPQSVSKLGSRSPATQI